MPIIVSKLATRQVILSGPYSSLSLQVDALSHLSSESKAESVEN